MGNIFYSHLAKVIAEAPARMSNLAGGQWSAWLAGNAAKLGVKQAEIEWSGVNDWLALQEGKVSREGVLGYLEGNGVRVEETVLGERITGLPVGWAVEQDKYENWQVVNERNTPVTTPQRSREGALSAMPARVSPTKYEAYTLPGGENYREILLTLPPKERGNNLIVRPVGEIGKYWEVFNETTQENEGTYDSLKEAQEDADRANKALVNAPVGYHSTHWDVQNVLAHIRVNDRVDSYGKKVLFVEELQSDFGQAARKDGFKFDAKDKSRLEEIQKQIELTRHAGVKYQVTKLNSASGMPEYWVTKGEGQNRVYSHSFSIELVAEASVRELNEYEATSNIKALYTERCELDHRKATGAGVPKAPFIDRTEAWVSLAVKRLIKMAVDGGYDRVAFISGEQSSDRYDLSKQVHTLAYQRNQDGTFDIKAYQERILEGSNIGDKISIDDLPDYVGKDAAEKMLRGDGKASRFVPWMNLTGVDLKVGGDGMKGFYDTIVPNVMRDVVKKLGGGQLETVDFGSGSKWAIVNDRTGESYYWYDQPNAEELARSGTEKKNKDQSVVGGDTFSAQQMDKSLEAISRQPGFTITDKMREIVQGVGVPLFQDSRGQFDTGSLTLTLLSTADESTFIHEAGHFYLEVLADVAGQDGAPLAIRQDLDAVLDWLEVPGGVEAWKSLSMTEKTPFHETFARGVEAYFMTGKAPTPELEGVFSRFAKFLSNVYKSVVGLQVELTPEIVSVFDRLVQSSVVDRQAVDGIQASLAAQLDSLDRFPAAVNQDYAGMVANFYGAVAGAAEMSVGDLAAKYPLQVRSDVHGLAPGGIVKTGTDSVEFKEWFGDSKVVGDDGGPLRVFHGTGAVFESFDMGLAGTNFTHLFSKDSGVYFTNNANDKYCTDTSASAYAKNAGRDGGANIIPVYLSMQHPLVIEDNDLDPVKYADIFRTDLRKWTREGKHDGLIIRQPESELESLGNRPEAIYIVFDPRQIKSIFNRGSWDRADPAILHQPSVQNLSLMAYKPETISKSVKEGAFSGMVLDVVGGLVTQRVNRDGGTVQHDLAALSKPVVVGAVVDIKYAGGVGVVSGLDKGLDGVGR